jgi:hypothetical protein
LGLVSLPAGRVVLAVKRPTSVLRFAGICVVNRTWLRARRGRKAVDTLPGRAKYAASLVGFLHRLRICAPEALRTVAYVHVTTFDIAD